MYSGYRVNGRISDRAEVLTPNFVLVLGRGGSSGGAPGLGAPPQ